MHGGAPSRHSEHIVVALFEDPSGIRIEDATVTATITGLGGLDPATIALEPMPIAGVVTYAGSSPLRLAVAPRSTSGSCGSAAPSRPGSPSPTSMGPATRRPPTADPAIQQGQTR
jgi:hypothetical protein